ncbi:MAG: hypothetical protein ABH846_01515, partial [Patescibacteria group bacterium]
MSTCIFPGKFQPFHNGQLLVVKGMMKACGKVMIVICHNGNEMFTTDEVREMISGALLGEDIVDATIVEVADCTEDSEWADKVLEVAERPTDPIIWSGDEAVRKIFEDMGVKTQKIALVPGITGEGLRQSIKTSDDSWRKQVPREVEPIINKH